MSFLTKVAIVYQWAWALIIGVGLTYITVCILIVAIQAILDTFK